MDHTLGPYNISPSDNGRNPACSSLITFIIELHIMYVLCIKQNKNLPNNCFQLLVVSPSDRVPPLAADLLLPRPPPHAVISAVNTGAPQNGHPLEGAATDVHWNHFRWEPNGRGTK